MNNNDVTMSDFISKLSYELQDIFKICELIFGSSLALIIIFQLMKRGMK